MIDTSRIAFSLDNEAAGIWAKQGPRTSALKFSQVTKQT